jgi:hypothetical protein
MNLRIILPQTAGRPLSRDPEHQQTRVRGWGAGQVFYYLIFSYFLDDSLLAASTGKGNRLRTVSRIVGNRDGAR